MRKILILLGSEWSPGSICVNAVIGELIDRGYEVHCVVNRLEGPAERNIYGAVIHKILPPLGVRFSQWKLTHPGKTAKFLHRLVSFLRRIKLLMLLPVWPLGFPLYSRRFLKEAEKLHRRFSFDLILSVYSPFETLLAGHRFKKRHPEVLFVPYMLDALSASGVPRFMSEQATVKKGLAWEHRLFSNADRIVIMESMTGHYERFAANEAYYERLITLGIPLLLRPFENGAESSPILLPGKINLVYTGSIPYNIRKPEYFLEIFSLLKIPDCVLTIIGYCTNPKVLRQSKDRSKNPIRIFDPVSHSEILDVLANADIFVNIGNNTPHMIPSKIFEYMSYGKPIISTCPIPDEPCIPYLRQYPLALLLSEDFSQTERDARAADLFISGSLGKTTEFDALSSKMYKNTPQAFADVIDKLF
ncbi:MAG TPA: hypothetical protein DEQ02_10755 [Ruminococcaceae bacterium]|nr:hypothetical protein [Oscillospiraceae bacterium]